MPRQNQPSQPNPDTDAPELVEALKEFRDSKPWKGSIEERQAKFATLHARLRVGFLSDGPAADWDIAFEQIAPGDLLASKVDFRRVGATKTLVCMFKLSVITYLYGVGCIHFRNQKTALKWAQSLFAHFFPRSAARTERTERGLTVKRSSTSNN